MIGSLARSSSPAPVPDWCLKGDALRERLTAALDDARHRTLALLSAIPDAALGAQPSPRHSPPGWVMGHLANFEERWLVRALGGDPLVPPEIDALYEPALQPVGLRGALPALTPASARAYLARVRIHALAALARTSFASKDPLVHGAFVFGWVLQHELRHQEALLETMQLLALAFTPEAPGAPGAGRSLEVTEVHVPGGPFVLGTDDDPWALDHERPGHVVEVPPFFIDAAPVSNAQYQAFIEDGGYRRRELWSDEGWAQVSGEGLDAPLYWQRSPDGWRRRRFAFVEPLPADEPVQHVSFHEAEAYARWANKRLPTEAEWEKAAAWDPALGKRRYPWGDAAARDAHANLGGARSGPDPIGAHPAGASPFGVEQMLGDVWEWTASPSSLFPGFCPFPPRAHLEDPADPGARVLRGGSWATHPLAIRCTTRRWAAAGRRELFAGFRCARSA